MKLDKLQKKFIKKNYRRMTLPQIASKLGLPEGAISEFLKERGKEVRGSEKIVSEKIKSFGVIKKILIENKIFLILLSLLIVAVFFNSLFAKFVSADDIATIYNQNVTNFSSALKSFNIHTIYLSFLYNIFGDNSGIFHLGSVILHILVSFLVFIVLYMIFGKNVARISTLLFAVHPVNAETVNWISAGTYLFFALFIFFAIISFLLYINSEQRKYLYISVGAYTLGLFLSRSPWILIFVPVISAINWFLINPRPSIKKTFKDISFFLPPSLLFVGLLFPAMFSGRISYLQSFNSFIGQESTSLPIRAPYTFYSMIRLLIFPLILSLFNEGNPISTPLYVFMIFVSFLYFVVIALCYRKNREIAGCMLIISLSILPTLSPVIIAFFMAERYLYIGSAFFCAIVSFLLLKVENRLRVNSLVIVACSSLLSLYSIRTFIRNFDWHDSLSLWLATQKVSPKSSRIYNNLGDAYDNVGNTEMSIKSFQKAIELYPEYSDAIHNLGYEYLKLGELDSAEKYLKKSLEINPNLFPAAYKLGVIEYKKGNNLEAKKYFEKTLEIAPGNLEAKQGLEIIDGLK